MDEIYIRLFIGPLIAIIGFFWIRHELKKENNYIFLNFIELLIDFLISLFTRPGRADRSKVIGIAVIFIFCGVGMTLFSINQVVEKYFNVKP